MAKKVYSLATFLDEKYGIKRHTFNYKLTPEQKAHWKKLHGSSKVLTPKAIHFIYDILGEPLEE